MIWYCLTLWAKFASVMLSGFGPVAFIFFPHTRLALEAYIPVRADESDAFTGADDDDLILRAARRDLWGRSSSVVRLCRMERDGDVRPVRCGWHVWCFVESDYVCRPTMCLCACAALGPNDHGLKNCGLLKTQQYPHSAWIHWAPMCSRLVSGR